MARYQIILAYDGTDFFGFQRQGNTRTVQAEVESALRQLGWQGRAIIFAGRTDSGVHASGQVAAFDLDWKHEITALGRAINAHLPLDVSVKEVMVAGPNFHPRYDALSRTYRYRTYFGEVRNPLLDRYAWRVDPPAKLVQLNQAAQKTVGRHDFAAFGSPPRTGGSTIREVYRAEWKEDNGGLWFEVTANAFLYRMVRRMVFLHVRVGQGFLGLEEYAKGVEEAKSQVPGLAPPQGLTLVAAKYVQNKQEDVQYFGTDGSLDTSM